MSSYHVIGEINVMVVDWQENFSGEERRAGANVFHVTGVEPFTGFFFEDYADDVFVLR